MGLTDSHLPSPLTAQRIDDDASVHDQLLWAAHLSGLDDLLLFLASSPTEQQWSLHVLEIISLMFRDQVRPWPIAPSVHTCTFPLCGHSYSYNNG